MHHAAKPVSLIALGATLIPSLLYFSGTMDHAMVKWVALLGTIVWFIATPLWMGRELPVDASEVEI